MRPLSGRQIACVLLQSCIDFRFLVQGLGPCSTRPCLYFVAPRWCRRSLVTIGSGVCATAFVVQQSWSTGSAVLCPPSVRPSSVHISPCPLFSSSPIPFVVSRSTLDRSPSAPALSLIVRPRDLGWSVSASSGKRVLVPSAV